MNFYKDLYYKLFAVIADAVESLENNEPIAARKVLIAGKRSLKRRHGQNHHTALDSVV